MGDVGGDDRTERSGACVISTWTLNDADLGGESLATKGPMSRYVSSFPGDDLEDVVRIIDALGVRDNCGDGCGFPLVTSLLICFLGVGGGCVLEKLPVDCLCDGESSARWYGTSSSNSLSSSRENAFSASKCAITGMIGGC